MHAHLPCPLPSTVRWESGNCFWLDLTFCLFWRDSLVCCCLFSLFPVLVSLQCCRISLCFFSGLVGLLISVYIGSFYAFHVNCLRG
ncbi:hypothetical protein NC652_025740 [Populus alba x Populus x berolinensis]|nr:hypothetical protein NC651_024642 [Populus alba x Populus x berolinensis]KAJ6899360.1 hypothetical protein NC652_025740 [Populus alba x Populus x berolinensis]